MWVEPPGTRKVYPQRNQVILKCRIEDSSLLFSQIFNVLLIVVCTVYAVKTRKIPENFNESKFIGFTMYTTCIIWLAFLPIYFGTANTNEVILRLIPLIPILTFSEFVGCFLKKSLYVFTWAWDFDVFILWSRISEVIWICFHALWYFFRNSSKKTKVFWWDLNIFSDSLTLGNTKKFFLINNSGLNESYYI